MGPSSSPAMVTFGGRGVLRSRMDAGRPLISIIPILGIRRRFRGLPASDGYLWREGGAAGIASTDPIWFHFGKLAGRFKRSTAPDGYLWGGGGALEPRATGAALVPVFGSNKSFQRLPASNGYLWEGGGCSGTACTDPIQMSSFPAQRCQKNKTAPPPEGVLPCIRIVPWERLAGCAGGHSGR